jgi:hypothetical protein
MDVRIRRFAVVASLVLCQAASSSGVQPPAPAPAKAAVDDLAWIAGAWGGTLNGRTIEQHWMRPAGGSMVGMYRSIRDGRATLYEILAIEARDGEVFLRIKHFAPGAGLVSREEKDQSVDYALVKAESRTAVFEGTGAAPARVTFHGPSPEALTITVEGERDGKRSATEFKYRRLPGS